MAPVFHARPYLPDVGPRPEEEEDGARVSLEAGDVEGRVAVRVVGVVDILPSLLHQEAGDANVTLLKLAMTHVTLSHPFVLMKKFHILKKKSKGPFKALE